MVQVINAFAFGGGGPTAPWDVECVTIFPASSVNLDGSGSYIDVLDGPGGSPVAVTITKGSGTSVLIMGSLVPSTTVSTRIITLGVNDGTTDYDLGRNSINPAADSQTTLSGFVLITGLGAGTYTFTLRVKESGTTGTCPFGTTGSASLTAMEVA